MLADGALQVVTPLKVGICRKHRRLIQSCVGSMALMVLSQYSCDQLLNEEYMLCLGILDMLTTLIACYTSSHGYRDRCHVDREQPSPETT